MLSPPDPQKQSSPNSNPVRKLMRSIFSYDNNIMLAAVISLLVVILFVLLLHIYAKWFLSHARRRRSRTPVSVSDVLGPTPTPTPTPPRTRTRFGHLDSLAFDADFPTKGLEASVIASIPLFVYQSDHELECVICLSVFEEGELGRKLGKCGHGFHVECVDMWLSSHSSCPICRAPAVISCESKVEERDSVSNVDGIRDSVNGEAAFEILVVENVPNSDENEGVMNGDSSSSSTHAAAAAAVLGSSLMRMLSRNRSDRKVRGSSNNVDESDD